MWGQRGKLSRGARGGRPGSRHGEGEKIRLLAEVEAKHKVREEWATLCERKLTSFEDYSAGGFLFVWLSFFLLLFFLQNIIDFGGRIFFLLVLTS
jgi:hypothetical protein